MATEMASRLEGFFEANAGEALRSIIRYTASEYEIVHLRDDVAAQYSEEEITAAIDEARMASLSAPLHEEAVTDDHGELSCLIQCFEGVIEMNYVLGDGTGVAVAIDADAMADAHGLVAEARRIVLSDRD